MQDLINNNAVINFALIIDIFNFMVITKLSQKKNSNVAIKKINISKNRKKLYIIKS